MCSKTHHTTWGCVDPSMTASHRRRIVKGQGVVSSPGLVGDSPAPLNSEDDWTMNKKSE